MDGTGATGLFIDSLLQGMIVQKNVLTTSLEIERRSPEAQDCLALLHPVSRIENIYKTALFVSQCRPQSVWGSEGIHLISTEQ